MMQTIERLDSLVLFVDLVLLGAVIYLIVELSKKNTPNNQKGSKT